MKVVETAPAARPEPPRVQAPAGSPHAEHVHLLEEDPDLGAGLSRPTFARANELLRARVVALGRGRIPPSNADPASTFGLYVLSGLMGRRVRVGRAQATELLGPGDILRPWYRAELLECAPAEIDWWVFQPACLAILDEQITRVIGRRPELLVAFSSRLLHRERSGAYLRAVSHLSCVDEKVLVTLWHLASRWGRVTPRGVELSFRLTHEVIAEIVGSRRPTVTLALSRMRRGNILSRTADGRVVLLGSPEDWHLARPQILARDERDARS